VMTTMVLMKRRRKSNSVVVSVGIVVIIIVVSVITLFQEGRTVHLPIGFNNHNSNNKNSRVGRNNKGHPLTASLFWYGIMNSSTISKEHSNFTSLNTPLFWSKSSSSTSNAAENSHHESLWSGTSSDFKKMLLGGRDQQDHHRPLPRPVKRIVLLGERHSGTTFVTKYLQDCFDGNSRTDVKSDVNTVVVSDRFVNTKHWFQPSPEYIVWTVLNSLSLLEDSSDRSFIKSSPQSSQSLPLELTKTPNTHQRSSFTPHYNRDDIDLDWWKEIVFGKYIDSKGNNNNLDLTMLSKPTTTNGDYISTINQTLLVNTLIENTRKFFETTLVIVLVRNPYDWYVSL
jgi:hypothetical protein